MHFLAFFLISSMASANSLHQWSWKTCTSRNLCFEVKGRRAQTSLLSDQIFAESVTLLRFTNRKLTKKIIAPQARFNPKENKWVLIDVREKEEICDYFFYPNENRFVRIPKAGPFASIKLETK